MKPCKKFIALLLALSLCLGTAPFLSLAYEAGDVVSEPEAIENPLPTEKPNGCVVSRPEEASPATPDQSDSGKTPVLSFPEDPVPAADNEPEEENALIGAEGAGITLTQMDLPSSSGNGIQAFSVPRESVLFIGWTTIGSNTGNLPSIGDNLTQCPTKMTLENGVYTAAYCLDIHLGATGGHAYTQGEAALKDSNKLSVLGDILAQGYQYSGSSPMPFEDRSKWLATQIFIWAAVNGTIKRDKNGLNVFDQSVTADGEKIAACCGDYSGYYSYAGELKRKLMNLRKIPSFSYGEESIALNRNNVKQLTAQGDGSFSKVLTDTNGVLEHFKFNFGGSITASADKNKLTVTATVPVENAAVSQEAKYEVLGGEKSVVCWKPADPSQQHFLTADLQPDPVSAYLAVRTGEGTHGSGGLVKTSEDGIVSGIPFQFTGGGQTFTLTTDASGQIDMSSLPVYEKKPVPDDKGVPQKDDSGNPLMEDDLSKPITYTVSENTPVRYVVPASQSFTPAGGSATLEFENRLKKFRVHFQKIDAETGSVPQGDAMLSGAVYGLYNSTGLLETYTTNGLGSFTTDWFPCGSDYYLKELGPSTGYLLNAASISVGAAPGDTAIEYNDTNSSGTEQVIKGAIRITKHTDKGETGIETPEEGAEFQVYLASAGSYAAAKPSERDVLTIDANGVAISKDMAYGLYNVHQTKSWEGKEMVNDFSVFISENGKVYAFILNNRVFESLITVVKKDGETGRVIPASGIGFKVRNTKTGEYVVQHINYPTPQDISIFYTDVTGKLMLPSALEAGSFELIETISTYGYVLDSTPVPFSVDGTAKEVIVEKLNTPQKGRIKIHKQGESFLSVSHENGLYTPIYGMVGLSGAKFSITAAQDIYTPDGSLRFVAGETVDTLTTNSLGECVSIPLYLGKYLVAEQQTTEGYSIDLSLKLVELSYAGQDYELTSTDLTVINQRQKAMVGVLKEMEYDEAFQIGTNNEYKNVIFGLFAAEDIEAADGSVIPTDGLLGTAAVTEGGRAAFTVDIPCGASLYVKEVATDPHYVLSDEKWPLQFSYAGQDVFTVFLHANSAAPVYNALKRGTIAGTKTDEDGLLLAGAVIGLFAPNETEFTEKTAILTSTSASNGDFSFENVPCGSWIVREITAPEGLLLNETPYPVTIEENAQKVNVSIENQFIKGSVRLEKIDSEFTGEKLSGAVFGVYADSNGNKEYDAGDVKIGTLMESETEKGIYTMDDLRYGGYFAVESIAPAYYDPDLTPRYFEIRKEGETVSLVVKNSPQLGSLLIRKTAEDGLVKGIRFTVTGKPYTGGLYKKEFETDEAGEILISDLRPGPYTVSEITDESTVRYIVQPDQNIVISPGNTIEVKYYNELRRGSIFVNKTDPDYPESKLTGAIFKVYRDVDFDRKFNPDIDTFYAELEADNGVYWLEGLPAGGFFLQEAKAPSGHVRDEEYHWFEIKEDTKQIEITNTTDPDAGFVNRPVTGILKILKVDSDSGAPLAGVNFCVKDLDGQSVGEGTTDKDGVVIFTDLKAGKYVYQEICARPGYETDSRDVPFEIKTNGQIVEVKVTNEKAPFYIPQTGDGRINPTFFRLVLIVSLVVACVIFLFLGRKPKSRKKEKE